MQGNRKRHQALALSWLPGEAAGQGLAPKNRVQMVFHEAHMCKCGCHHTLSQLILLVGEGAVNPVLQLVFDIQLDVHDAADDIIHRLCMLPFRGPE